MTCLGDRLVPLWKSTQYLPRSDRRRLSRRGQEVRPMAHSRLSWGAWHIPSRNLAGRRLHNVTIASRGGNGAGFPSPGVRSGRGGGEGEEISEERGTTLLCTCSLVPNERLLLGREHFWYHSDPLRGRRAGKLRLRLPIATPPPPCRSGSLETAAVAVAFLFPSLCVSRLSSVSQGCYVITADCTN